MVRILRYYRIATILMSVLSVLLAIRGTVARRRRSLKMLRRAVKNLG
ncbi:hypothetical protein [Effusibacillus consociatus]|uniref:Uncharacterized protein n=1 Tax=Effusibacillus consociatus TaxID=1117041 RepID=A0ABV9Q6F2_9BACL